MDKQRRSTEKLWNGFDAAEDKEAFLRSCSEEEREQMVQDVKAVVNVFAEWFKTCARLVRGEDA